MKRICLLALLVMTGCAAPSPVPGSEHVRVVSSDEAVRGGTLLASTTGTIGALNASQIPQLARNFGANHGANMVLLRQSAAQNTVVFTFEAWQR